MSALGQANTFFGNLVRLALVGLLATGGFLGWRVWNGEQEHAREMARKDAELKQTRDALATSQKELAAVTKEKDRLALALKLMKIDRRVARVIVLEQTPPANGAHGSTRLKFEEVDAGGNPLGPAKELTIEGDVLYVDSWVVKFEDGFIERGDDPLRAASLVLFRRLFGEHQAPTDGVTIDASGARPVAYGGEADLSGLEREIWTDFWAFANDPARAAKLGVRAAHGEAPSMQLKKGEVYVLTLRASGGLTFQPDRPGSGGR